MGCTYSRVDVDEVVWQCKERRRLMKQLLSCRAELAAAHMAYLQSLRNTGATLRQFTEVETMIPGGTPPIGLALPPSPPPPPTLPPSPPPPPEFSPRAAKEVTREKLSDEDSSDMDDDESCPMPPPPLPSSVWDCWDPSGPPASSGSSSPVPDGGDVTHAAAEEEDWAETKTEFGEGEEEEEVVVEDEDDKAVQRKEAFAVALNRAREKCPAKELADDSLSAASWFTKDTDIGMVVWRSKKTLEGIIKELDDYFLKAAAGGKDLAVLLESNRTYCHPWDLQAREGRSSTSAKVVNVLSWNWSFKSTHSNRDAQDENSASRPSNHCTTLEKLFAEEQKLYKLVKDEESANSQHKKIILLLHKLEAGDYDWTKTEKARSDIEDLQCQMVSLKEAISGTCLSILKLRDEELFPQLIEFSVGLEKMWRTMYECHQVQNHVSQQANLLDSHLGNDPTTDSHRHAISQLEAEVTSWYSSFCDLFRCQREYVRILNQWVRLTDRLPENNAFMGSTSSIRGFCEELQGVLDGLPDKVAAEAIKNFLLVIRSIVLQHTEEHSLQKKSDRLQRRLEKELNSLGSIENLVEVPHVNHPPSSTKHAKLEAFKKRVEEERIKYLNSVHTSRAMIVNNLQTSLPNVFQALMGFSSVCVQAFESITGSVEDVTSFSDGVSPVHQ
ncbi:protein ALTERED PHOSPHATE STARVATION RESPONSE 1-like [Musa acuminata AAA Group]|uniref:protein ALTERED PHOSPHATE STARVATION RESPONSE 1-like n=1 Tax=Musa acuminata AAA Group TaxID=214697 RepID=UPI0031CE4D26